MELKDFAKYLKGEVLAPVAAPGTQREPQANRRIGGRGQGAAAGETSRGEVGGLHRHLRAALPLQIFPLISRTERRLHERRLTELRDASDLPHAVTALMYRCEAIVAYDHHFKAIAHVIPYKTPEDYL